MQQDERRTMLMGRKWGSTIRASLGNDVLHTFSQVATRWGKAIVGSINGESELFGGNKRSAGLHSNIGA